MSSSHSPGTGHGHELGFISKYVFSTDHKVIGIQFLISSLIFLLLGGFLALGVRTQIGWPDMAFPKLNMMSYWFMWPAGICMLLSFTVFGGAASNGWTSYPTISSITSPAGEGMTSPSNMGSGWGQTLWLI